MAVGPTLYLSKKYSWTERLGPTGIRILDVKNTTYHDKEKLHTYLITADERIVSPQVYSESYLCNTEKNIYVYENNVIQKDSTPCRCLLLLSIDCDFQFISLRRRPTRAYLLVFVLYYQKR